MKPLDWTYELRVFGTCPRALPLEDFGELTKRFADLLGSQEHVRFGALRTGSARLFAKVLDPALQDVQVQLLRAKQDDGTASGKVVKLNDFFCSRKWHGELRNRQGGTVLVFPGAKNAKPLEDVRTVQQVDTLTGKVIKIGGKDETVPMTLETSDGSFVDVTLRGRDLAKRLAQYLFGKDVRVSGLATWKRDTSGAWSCVSMIVDSFDAPDETSLADVFSSLRDLSGNGWNDLDDPIAEWKKLRGDD